MTDMKQQQRDTPTLTKFQPEYAFADDLLRKDPDALDNSKYTVLGLVRRTRESKDCAFVELYDGTDLRGIQLVLPSDDRTEKTAASKVQAGAYIQATGVLVKSLGFEQPVELKVEVTGLVVEGAVNDTATYLPSAKRVPIERLRGPDAYLRARFVTFQAIHGIRDTLMFHTSAFMRKQMFKHLDPNIVTVSDCEGAGEMFTITTMGEREVAKLPVDAKTGRIDFTLDFFLKQAGLTVSSQLPLEALCVAGKGVFTMNKSFRAEKSKTTRHLAEFTHLEWESRLLRTLEHLMNFSEDLVTYLVRRVLEECQPELQQLDKFVSCGIIKKLQGFVSKNFARMSYTEAVGLLWAREQMT